MRRLQLGPIVGHTDTQSTRVWIRVLDHPAHYELRIRGVGKVSFASTETTLEFGTAVAVFDGLRPDWQYRYEVLRRGRIVPGARGTFRTMPLDTSMAEIQFVFVSCNHQENEGAWQQLKAFIDDAKPRFLLMIGDQVYVDQTGDVWESHFDEQSDERRRALAQKYQDNWHRELLQEIMANIPTYMIWDDHEIRDGWGSWAPDSPTMLARYARGAKIFARHDAFFRDARDVYYHFQMSHNPSVNVPLAGERTAMPFAVRCGRLLVLMLDSRGARDIWRKEDPVLGTEQWQFIDDSLENLDPAIDVVAVVTATPIATMSPQSLGQKTLGRLEPDVRFFRRGDARSLSNLINSGGTPLPETNPDFVALNAIAEKTVFKARAKIDEVRDQWSHYLSRPEQERLIRRAAEASRKNRVGGNPRRIIFLGGDIHIGGIFDLTVSKPSFTAPCVVSSGISQSADKPLESILTVDETFQVSRGITAKQRLLVQQFNFGLIQIVPTGGTAEVVPAVVHQGTSGTISGQLGG
jgi:hypothetical protein